MTSTATVRPMTAEELLSIEQSHVGDYLGHGWTQDYIEGNGDEPAYYRVATPDGTVVATMPDWAGGIAVFLAEAHDAVPKLIAEIRRLRSRLAEVAELHEPMGGDCGYCADETGGAHSWPCPTAKLAAADAA